MVEIGFSKVLLILCIALVVLGPEKLPKLAAQVGRWTGRARAMARQLRTQLEQEIELAEINKEKKQAPAPVAPVPTIANPAEQAVQAHDSSPEPHSAAPQSDK
jgi:sec-independent protein translocase protein TatB